MVKEKTEEERIAEATEMAVTLIKLTMPIIYKLVNKTKAKPTEEKK